MRGAQEERRRDLYRPGAGPSAVASYLRPRRRLAAALLIAGLLAVVVAVLVAAPLVRPAPVTGGSS